MAYPTKQKVPAPNRDERRDVTSFRRPARDDRLPARIGSAGWLTFIAILAIPVFAMSRQIQAVDSRILFGVPLVMSVIAFLAYRTDKRKARDGQWRTAESTLHMMEMIGGWPGAFLAQRRYRHKTAKVSFQVTFWSIVFLHNLIAFDSILGWKFASRIMEVIK